MTVLIEEGADAHTQNQDHLENRNERGDVSADSDSSAVDQGGQGDRDERDQLQLAEGDAVIERQRDLEVDVIKQSAAKVVQEDRKANRECGCRRGARNQKL